MEVVFQFKYSNLLQQYINSGALEIYRLDACKKLKKTEIRELFEVLSFGEDLGGASKLKTDFLFRVIQLIAFSVAINSYVQ